MPKVNENEELELEQEDEFEIEDEEISPIEDLLAHAIDGDFASANKAFDDIMADRIDDAMDQERAAIANDVFNGVADETEIDDEDIVDDETGEVTELDDEDIEFLNDLEGDEDED